MEAVELDPVQEQLEGTLANLGEELIVACPVSERARKRQRGKAKKLAVLALTVDAKSQARVHQFNRVAEDNVAQVPKLTQLLSHLTRIVDDEDAGDDAGAFELHFEGGKELGCVAETLDLQKEFCWCCLHICHANRRMPSSNIDYIDLSLWAQAHGLEEAYALSHAIFRQRGEDALRGDGEPGSDVQGLMTSAEENDVLELLDQSQMSISDVRKFEVQLADKLRALEESNIHSILQSVELAEDVCFRLDTASNAVDELTSWIEENNRSLVDIQDGIKEIESQNNKLDTVHRSNEKLEGTLREVLEQLSMPDDMQAALLEGELGVESRAGRKLAMEERVVPAARRLALGLQLELKSGMQVRTPLKTRPPRRQFLAAHASLVCFWEQEMQVVREQKSQFIILRSKFATRAYECIKARFYNKAEVLREAHATDSHSSHALGDRSALYSASMANVSALLGVLKVLDRGPCTPAGFFAPAL